MRTLSIISTTLLGLLVLTGCATSPKLETSMTKEQILQQPDVKKNPPTVFHNSLEEVRQAGLRALTFVGCETKKQEPYFLSGRRPNKVGLFVGSGGETVRIFLYPQGPTETHVWVDTNLSFVGIAGQQSWDAKVFAEMKNILQTPVSNQ